MRTVLQGYTVPNLLIAGKSGSKKERPTMTMRNDEYLSRYPNHLPRLMEEIRERADRKSGDVTRSTLFKPNTLVQYEGGGYEGCWWEWNFAYITPDSQFVNLACSGRNGCETLEKLEAYYQRTCVDTGCFTSGKFFLYDLSDKKSLTEVPDELNVDHLVGVANELKKAGYPVDFQPECSECESRFSIEGAAPNAVGGDGGIHMSHREIICEECQGSYTCCACGEYVGSDGMTKGSRSCKYCDDKGDD